MPEPLKNLYTKNLIQQLAECLHHHQSSIEPRKFVNRVFCPHWPDLELKQRMRHITLTLKAVLPDDFEQAVAILIECSQRFNGFETMFFPEYVELFGLQHFESSMQALEIMTEYSSSEFAVRPFIKQHTVRMMQQMTDWSLSDNLHVRRLASEGCRPRLPWAMALPDFKRDPAPIFPILDNLKKDDSEYVRRSVANNLNDISKDHPGKVLKTARAWQGISDDTDRLIKHACRTLLKQGHADALSLFGFSPPDHIDLKQFKCQKSVKLGEDLVFSFTLASRRDLGLCRIEYCIYFNKANESLSPKVFKISEGEFSMTNKRIDKKHSFKQISTRRYYPGRHQIEVILNGKALGKLDFVLH